jgi:hypothetical protein
MSIDSVVKEIIDAIKYSVSELDYDRQDGRIGGVGRIRALCDLLDDAYKRLSLIDDELRKKIREIVPERRDQNTA